MCLYYLTLSTLSTFDHGKHPKLYLLTMYIANLIQKEDWNHITYEAKLFRNIPLDVKSPKKTC